MFVCDRPIEDKKDDRLGRSFFSCNLAKSITEWKGKDSLVIALYGKWGAGKSSVINLATTNLFESKDQNKPTIIEFNPWLFSGEEKLNEHFFNELAKELEIQNKSEKDIELAHRIRSYSKLFNLIPDDTMLNRLIEKFFIVLGLIGISTNQILQLLGFDIGNIKIVIFCVGVLLILLSLFNKITESVANYLEEKGVANQKTVLSFKREIKEALLKRNNKILVILDDIDRLTPEEVRLVLKLVKINTDFPNIIYLLSFDREIVQKALESQPGIKGQDYIEKIVQVSFDIPLAKQEKISKVLFEELDRVIAGLPKKSEKLFDQTYWGNIYHSGFKNFFRNIRDVKRFTSSLEFNFSLMFKGESIEVNPIDFIAIEAIRVFAPDFYNFMRVNSELFTSTSTVNEYGTSQENSRKKEIEESINRLPSHLQDDLKKMIGRLFPQVDGVLKYGYSSHGHSWIPNWNRELRVCSPKFFDVYFTLIPGGDESEISQFEIDLILDKVTKQEDFENILREFLEKGKIKKVLERLEDYTKDLTKIPQNTHLNIIQTLFNISDVLPVNRDGMFDFGADLQCARIIHQLLSQNTDKENNYSIFKKAIEESKGLYGPIYNVSLESNKNQEEKDDMMLVPKNKLNDLHKLCLEKINDNKINKTLKTNPNLPSILYRWKGWSNPENDDWKKYIENITSSNQDLIDFIRHFVAENFTQTFGDYVGRKIKKFNYKSLEDFIDIGNVKTRLETIKDKDSSVYSCNKEIVDIFLDNYGKKPDPFDQV